MENKLDFNHVLMTWVAIITLTATVIGGGIWVGSISTKVGHNSVAIVEHITWHESHDDKIFTKLDEIKDDVSDLAIDQARINGELANELKNISKNLGEIQKKR